jgi:hypothetical protein
MILYVYNAETKRGSGAIEGNNNAACEAVAAQEYCDTEVYGWTYSPASGTNDGLTRSDDVVELTA